MKKSQPNSPRDDLTWRTDLQGHRDTRSRAGPDCGVGLYLDSQSAAARMDALLSDAASILANHPQIGKSGGIAGTRELIVHKNFRLVYEIAGQYGLTLVHVARQWPPLHQ